MSSQESLHLHVCYDVIFVCVTHTKSTDTLVHSCYYDERVSKHTHAHSASAHLRSFRVISFPGRWASSSRIQTSLPSVGHASCAWLCTQSCLVLGMGPGETCDNGQASS